MGLRGMLDAMYYNKYRPETLRQLVLPAGASITTTANVAGSTYGVWVDVVAAAGVLVDTLVVGVYMANPSATDEFTVDIGSCLVGGVNYANAAAVIAAGAAVIAAAHRAEVAMDWLVTTVTAVGTHSIAPTITPLFAPVLIPAGVGIIARSYGVTAAAVTIDVRVACLQGFA